MPNVMGVQTSLVVGVAFLKEDDYIVAYCPALELSSYGKTEEEAKRGFEEALAIFIEETTRKGSLQRVLTKLGWIINVGNYQPPDSTNQKLMERFEDKATLSLRKIPIRFPELVAN